MAYLIRRKQPIDAEIRRVLLEQNHRARTLLESWSDAPPGRIHATRQSFKRIRALLRLIRPGHRYVYRVENAEYRELGHVLAFERDNAALLDALELLRPHVCAPLAQESLRMLRAGFERRASRDRESGMPALQAKIARVIDSLDEAGRRIPDLPLESVRRRDLHRGVKGVLKRCVATFERARERRTTVDLHEWRKDAKTAYHHTRLMLELIPGWAETTGPQLERLADVLGRYHDLSLLDAALERQADELDVDTHLRAIRRLVRSVSGDLADSALGLGATLFSAGAIDVPELARRRIDRG